MRGHKMDGFTLIELLVVIAIIALLMAILAPSLNMAKEMARSVACSAHIRGAGLGLAGYTNSWNDWLPGPNTSGLDQTFFQNPSSSSTEPVQNMDWISPILGEDLSLPNDRKERIKAIFETGLRCPSNRKKFDYEYAGTGGGSGLFAVDEIRNMTASSYAAALAFHVLNFAQHSDDSPKPIFNPRPDIATVPRGYRPKLTRIGKPAEKVFAMDGTRYLIFDSGRWQISFNSFLKQKEGGNYMVFGPVMHDSGDPYHWKDYDYDNPEFDDENITETYSFRHNKKINVLFFDGHTERLGKDESLDMRMYWPRGSRIVDSNQTYDTDDHIGQTIK